MKRPPVHMRDELKRGLSSLLGRTIAHVVAKEAEDGSGPRYQLYLVFTDGTCYEFFSDSLIDGASGCDEGDFDRVRRWGSTTHRNAFEA